jgi:hypothetical protein
MKSSIIFWSTLLLCSIGTASGVSRKPGIEQIKNEILKNGIRNEVDSMYLDGVKWRNLLKNISKADSAWISIGLILSDSSDAAAAESIHQAFGESLERDPSRILGQIDSAGYIYGVCGGPDVDDPKYNSYERAMKAIEKRTLKLKALKKIEFQSKIETCIEELEKSKRGIRKFYRK